MNSKLNFISASLGLILFTGQSISASAIELTLNPGEHATLSPSTSSTVYCRNPDPNAPQLPYCSIASGAGNATCRRYLLANGYDSDTDQRLCLMIGTSVVDVYQLQTSDLAAEAVAHYKQDSLCR